MYLQVCCPQVIILVQAEAQMGQVLQLWNLIIKLIPNNKEFWEHVIAVLQNGGGVCLHKMTSIGT